jgi:hypothetical protein
MFSECNGFTPIESKGETDVVSRQIIGYRALHSSTPTTSRQPDDNHSPTPTTLPPKKQDEQTTTPIRRHENIYTLPNILTLTRLISAPAICYLILHDAHTWALSLFLYAALTDLLDGYLARRYGLQTVVGSVIDPMADKALMTIGIVCLAIKGAIPRKVPLPLSLSLPIFPTKINF